MVQGNHGGAEIVVSFLDRPLTEEVPIEGLLQGDGGVLRPRLRPLAPTEEVPIEYATVGLARSGALPPVPATVWTGRPNERGATIFAPPCNQ